MCPRMRTRLYFPKEDAVELGGSCQCGAVRFSVDSTTPYPYMACYCSICRKTAGGGGYAINLGGGSSSLKGEGEENLTIHQARIKDPGNPEHEEVRPARRH